MVNQSFNVIFKSVHLIYRKKKKKEKYIEIITVFIRFFEDNNCIVVISEISTIIRIHNGNNYTPTLVIKFFIAVALIVPQIIQTL